MGAVGENADDRLQELAVAEDDARAGLVHSCERIGGASKAGLGRESQIKDTALPPEIQSLTESNTIIAEGGVDGDDDRVLAESGEGRDLGRIDDAEGSAPSKIGAALRTFDVEIPTFDTHIWITRRQTSGTLHVQRHTSQSAFVSA